MSRALKILIVDDSPEDRETYKIQLGKNPAASYAFDEAATADSGLALFAKGQHDCVIVDYDLPGDNGVDFLNALADAHGPLSTAVIMLTGVGSQDIAVAAMKAGAQDYLIKGKITANGLQRAVTNAVAKVGLERTVERQRLELETRNRDLEAFASVVAHDLKAPLFKVQMISDTVASLYATSLDEKGRGLLGKMRESLLRMQHLIDALLSYAVVGNRPAPFETVDLNRAVSDALADLEAHIKVAGARVTVEPLAAVEANPVLLRQLFQNLVANAIKYRREGVAPEIAIRGEALQSRPTPYAPKPVALYRVAVSDNGIGFDEREAGQIFIPFQRLHRDDKYGGVGIGLATCRKIVDLHKGALAAKSAPGQGSTFFVTLPVRQEG